MNVRFSAAAALAAVLGAASPALSQDTDTALGAEAQAEASAEPVIEAAPADQTRAAPVDVAAPAAPQFAGAGGAAGKDCELHVWPTHNYIGFNSGLLTGFGLVGALADQAVHADKVRTVKDLMRDYLGPDVQVAELDKAALLKTLKLEGYRVVLEEPTPFNEDLKRDPALKAKVKALNARIKSKQRLSASKNRCYAELITTHIFYHKAFGWGSNLFTGWIYREFGDGPTATKIATGQVKNPLEHFPPKEEATVEAAKAELRDAYARDFKEYVEKKVKP
jgi:hypothetical protein